MRNPLSHRAWHVVSSALSILYPSRCPVCTAPSDSALLAPFCTACWSGIHRYQGPSCSICAIPTSSELTRICKHCSTDPPPFSYVLTYSLYADTLREALHQLKFNGIKRLARCLGTFLADLPLPAVDGIVPVPLSTRALRQRGFNQTALLARTVAKRSGIPLHLDVLSKRKETEPQATLNAKERAVNLRNAFEVVAPVADKRLMLVDDVMTTGATVRECSRTLLRAGAQEIVVVTLARSPLD